MFDTGETLQDIEKWAQAKFPHEFKAVKDYLRDNYITALDHSHEDAGGCKLDHSVPVGHAGHVGTNVVPVDAHVAFEEENDLEPWVGLCFPSMDGDHCDGISRRNTIFEEPFSWLNPGTSMLGSEQFDALIQFIYLPSALSAGMQRIEFDALEFKKHFKGACQVIAVELEERRRQNKPAASPATSQTLSVASSLTSEPLLAATSQPTIAAPSLTSEPLPSTQKQKKPGDMEEFFATQKASFERFVKASQAADRQEKTRLLAEITKLNQKLAKTKQECKDSKNQLLEYKTNLENIEATLRARDVDVENYVAELDRAKNAAIRKNAEEHKKEVRKVKEEVKRLTGEVEKLKKEAAESSQEATKAKRSLEDIQELEEFVERFQKRRIV